MCYCPDRYFLCDDDDIVGGVLIIGLSDMVRCFFTEKPDVRGRWTISFMLTQSLFSQIHLQSLAEKTPFFCDWSILINQNHYGRNECRSVFIRSLK